MPVQEESAPHRIAGNGEERGRSGRDSLLFPDRTTSALILSDPQEVTRAFAKALSAADLKRAASLFADDCCFITPDATAVYGRRGITTTLVQLTGSQVQLRVAPETVHVVGGTAFCKERWTFTYVGDRTGPFIKVSDSTVLLRRRDGLWRLSVVAPWHIMDADRFL